MPPQLHEVYYAPIEVGFAAYARPFIIVDGPVADPNDPNRLLVLIAPISSAQDCKQQPFFDLPDPDWRAVGLKRPSYVLGSKSRWLDAAAVGKRLGRMSGPLLQRFLGWAQW